MPARLIPVTLLLALRWLIAVQSPGSAAAAAAAEAPRLELVQVLFRSGERTPGLNETYPGDPYAGHAYEPWGRGRLTDLGRYRGRRLARALRKRYADFLAGAGGGAEVHAYSVDREDCRESLRCLLDALLGEEAAAAGGKVVRLDEEEPRAIDALMSARQCDEYRERLERVRRSPEVRKKLARFDGLYRYIEENIGMTVDESRPDDSLFQLYELLERQRSLNLTLPNWCPTGVLELLGELAIVHLNLQSQTTELKRLNGGPLVRRFLEDAKRRSGGRRGLRVYAAEVEQVAAYARAQDRRFPGVPSPGSAVILESRRAPADGRLYLRLLMWTGHSEKLFPVALRGCAEHCPLEEYVKIVDKVLPDDGELHCLLEESEER